MKVKNRTLLIVGSIILILSSFYLFQGISQYDREIKREILTEEDVINDIVANTKKYSFSSYDYIITELVEENQPMRQAFADRNRELLNTIMQPIFKRLAYENEYFHAMDFNLPNGTVFLRVQKPDFFGDNISQTRQIIAATHKTRKQQTGYDIGKHGALYWVTEAIHHNGEYVGAIEFGIEVAQLKKALQERLQKKVSTILKANRWQKAIFIKHGFRTFGDYILMTRGSSIFDHVPEGYNFFSEDREVDINGKTHILHNCSALRDYNGVLIGRILVFQDISEKIARKTNFIYSATLLTSLLLAFSFVVLYYSFNSLIGRLERYAHDNQKAKEDIQHAHDELEKRVKQRTTELAKANTGLQNEIKERRLLQEKSEGQSEFLKSIIESLSHPFYVVDAETYEVKLANKAACAINNGQPYKGLTCYQMTHHCNDICSGEDHPCALKEVKKTKKPATVQHNHIYNDEERTFEIYAYPVFDKKGNVSQVIEYTIDITHRKIAEEEKKKIWSQLIHSQKMEAVGRCLVILFAVC